MNSINLVGRLTRDPELRETKGDTKVALYSASEDDLQKIHWESKELSVDVVRKKDARGDYVWVDATERKEKAAAKVVPPVPA